MTKYYLRLLLLVGCVIAFFALIGSLLPRSYEFAAEIDIDATSTDVFNEINQLSNWKSWSQWNPADIPGLTVKYSGPESGVGCTQSWTEARGNGKLWITESVAHESIGYEMLFANFPKMSSKLQLNGQDAKTQVRWASRGRLPGGPFYGFFAPFFSTHMEAEYQKSLVKLKNKLESGN